LKSFDYDAMGQTGIQQFQLKHNTDSNMKVQQQAE
jgi:hypothetical protein